MRPLKAFINKDNLHKVSIRKGSFKKKDLECGTIVKFRDDTFGVYVNDEMAEYMKYKLELPKTSDEYFITYWDNTQKLCYLNLKELDGDLICPNDDCDVIRIYDRVLSDKEIENFDKNTFYSELISIIKGMKYIER